MEPPLPYLDKIVMKIEPEDNSRVISFEAGDVDYINANMLPPTDFVRVDKEGKFQAEGQVSEPGYLYLIFNCARAPFDNKEARQAVAYAVDREAINQVAYGGLATPRRARSPRSSGGRTTPTSISRRCTPLTRIRPRTCSRRLA